MKYIDYQERAQQGTFNFPIAFYHQTTHSPRYDMQYHWHTQYEIIRIISGTFQLKLEKSTMLCKAGDVIFITSGMLHGGTPHDCIYECIVFDLQILLKNNHACSRIIKDIIDQKITVNTCLSETSETVYEITFLKESMPPVKRVVYSAAISLCYRPAPKNACFYFRKYL